jgi:pimeloyl-ACP methyl ester carboxylesterase
VREVAMNSETVSARVGNEELVIYVDQPDSETIGSVLITSPFGMSAARMLPAAYILRESGFRVVRFDPRHHAGSSTGSSRGFRLSGLVDDLEKVLELTTPDVLMAVSMSARSVIRALVRASGLSGAVLVTPVVDVRYTLDQVLQRDYFAVTDRDPSAVVQVLGQDVEMEFIDDCVEAGMVDVRDSIADFTAIETPVSCIVGAADPWVLMDDVRASAEAAWDHGRDFAIVTVEAATHQLYRNPALAMTYFTEAAKECLRLVSSDPGRLRVPMFADVIAEAERTTR